MSNQIRDTNPIGVFDSGLGGLTLVKQLRKQLFHEDIVYFGDTAHVPYGSKSKESIVRFSIKNTEILLKKKVKLIVVACNSSTAYALKELQKRFEIPIVGVIEAGVKRAVVETMNKNIGVIATRATVNSGAYKRLMKKVNPCIQFYEQACPLLVPIIEEGWGKSSLAKDVMVEYIRKLKRFKVDTIILGCTHYPLIKRSLKMLNKEINFIDSGREVVREVKQILEKRNLCCQRTRKGRERFLINDRLQDFKRIAREFLGEEINNVRKVDDV